MTLKRTPRPRDPIQLGKLMVDIATGQVPDAVDDGKRQGVAGGLKGGAARSINLTDEQKTKAARHAALARWKKP